ncbi:MAG: FecR domain-containing protein [Armatimonadetes bacterium]|nr:FecR domain-containing protein [Armatimonadota bacterium]
MKTRWPRFLVGALLALTLSPTAAMAAREPGLTVGTPQSFEYQIGEQSLPDTTADGGAALPADDTAPSEAGQGPIRLARFSYVRGNVTWRPSDTAAWSPATVNLPLRQGAQVWVANGGRAEVQFDDGSLLRLGNGAVVTLQTLYSDADGEFTELQMSEGLCTLRLRHAQSIFQVDTPLVSVKSVGPSNVRIGVDASVEIAVRGGSAVAEGGQGKQTLRSGDYMELVDASAPYDIGSVPGPDSWDRWNDDRDRLLAGQDSGRLPPNIALVAGDLDDYGAWHADPVYGEVWCPRVVDVGWRPYQHGRWVWVEPFGWTWVSSEAWGWAPYHYGTWVDEPYGWAWVPGPVTQYWCPAVVHFCEYNGAVAWAPLAPPEVRYPSVLSIGFRSGNWSLFFSIGAAAVYYPASDHYCAPRAFNNVVVNRTVYVNKVTNIYNINNTTVNRNVYVTNYHFVPQNARAAAGVTTASLAAFGGRGEYQPAPRAAGYFVRGRSIGAPAGGAAPVAGPIAVRPTAMAFTPSRTYLPAVHPAAPVLQRPLFRAALPARVARVAPALPHPQALTPRPGLTTRPDRGPVTPAFGGPTGNVPGTQRPLDARERARQDALAARQSLGQPTGGPAGSGGPRPPRAFRGTTGTTAQPGTFEGARPGPFGGRRNESVGTTRPAAVRPASRPYRYSEGSGLDRRPLSSRPARTPRAGRPARPGQPASGGAPRNDHGGNDRGDGDRRPDRG